MPSKLQKTVDGLTLEDSVLLHWKHTKGDARKYGNGSIGGFLIKRDMTLLECLETCGKGDVAQRPPSPFMLKHKTSKVRLHMGRKLIEKDGSMQLVNKEAEGYSIRNTIQKYLRQSKLQKQMEDCQQKFLASGGHKSKSTGKLILEVDINEKMPLDIGIKKSQLQSEELEQCAKVVLQSIEPFHHSLSFKAKAIVKVKFFK